MSNMGLQVVDMDTQVKKTKQNIFFRTDSGGKCNLTCSSPEMTSSSLACGELWTLYPVCWWCDITTADWTARRLLHPAPWLHFDPMPVLWEGTVQIPYTVYLEPLVMDVHSSERTETQHHHYHPHWQYQSLLWCCLHQNLLQIVISEF